jgi:hypothetical protein
MGAVQQHVVAANSAFKEARLSAAYLSGRRVGLLNAPSPNEYPSGTPEHDDWERGRASGERDRLFFATAAVPPQCRYFAQDCACGARGECIPVA